jgi:UrcA family protein
MYCHEHTAADGSVAIKSRENIMKVLVLAFAAAAAVSAPAMAYQLKTDTTGDKVRISALPTSRVDFTDPAQAKAFYAKVKRAAAEVCTAPSFSSTISRPDADCMSRAVAAAVKNADRPLLTAAYNSDLSGNRALAGNDQ